MVTQQLFMEPVVHDPQIPVSQLDHPVCHNLTGNVDVVPLEFLTDPIQWQAICVLGIHDAGAKRRGDDTVSQQTFGSVCFYDCLIVLSGIDFHMVYFNSIDCRLHFHASVDLIRKLFPAIFAEDMCEFFL